MNTNEEQNPEQFQQALNILDDMSCEKIEQMTTLKINNMKQTIMDELELDPETRKDYLVKLKDYKYIDDISDLRYGAFIMWIPILELNTITLQKCGIICDIQLGDEHVLITCKNYMHRHYTFRMDECLVFQKLSNQEKIIIQILDQIK